MYRYNEVRLEISVSTSSKRCQLIDKIFMLIENTGYLEEQSLLSDFSSQWNIFQSIPFLMEEDVIYRNINPVKVTIMINLEVL